MPKTYEPIATTTVGTATNTITFSSIPGTYTDLVLVFVGTGTSVNQEGLYVQFNSDTTSNYSQTYLRGTGSVISSPRQSNVTKIFLCSNTTDSGMNNAIMHIMNYANTTTNKTTLLRSNDPSARLEAVVGLWRKTPEAINTITITPDSGTIDTGCIFSIYGIKAA